MHDCPQQDILLDWENEGGYVLVLGWHVHFLDDTVF